MTVQKLTVESLGMEVKTPHVSEGTYAMIFLREGIYLMLDDPTETAATFLLATEDGFTEIGDKEQAMVINALRVIEKWYS